MSETNALRPWGTSVASLIAGVLSLALLVIHFAVTPTQAFTLYVSIAFAVAGVVSGIVALRRRELVGVAVAGVVTSVLGLMAGGSLLMLAVAFAYGGLLF